MLKVLWFSNTPALGSHFLNENKRLKSTGGWLDALNSAMSKHVKLLIAFHHPYRRNPFEYLDTSYYPIYTGNFIVNHLRRLFFNNVLDSELLDLYLDIIDDCKPDLIHIQGTENPFLCILGKTNIPIVVSIQGNLTVYSHKFNSGFFGKYLFHVRRFNLKSVLLGLEYFNKGKSRLSKMALIENKRMKDIRYVIGRTDWDYRITRILAPKSVYFKGDELLRELFYKFTWNNLYRGGKLILYTINGDNYYKGLETVFECLNLLQRNNVNVEWRVAGVDSDSLIVSICKRHLGVNFPRSGYVLLGSLDEEELVNGLLDSHIYIMPSHIENSPNNLCEAMILGMPCISTYAGGTGSMIRDGEDGVLIQDGDPWVMAGAILELIDNENKLARIAKNARTRGLNRHNLYSVVQRYLEIYHSIVE